MVLFRMGGTIHLVAFTGNHPAAQVIAGRFQWRARSADGGRANYFGRRQSSSQAR